MGHKGDMKYGLDGGKARLEAKFILPQAEGVGAIGVEALYLRCLGCALGGSGIPFDPCWQEFTPLATTWTGAGSQAPQWWDGSDWEGLFMPPPLPRGPFSPAQSQGPYSTLPQ